MMIKTTRDISIAFIEANKNNRGLDLIGHKEWVDKEKLLSDLLELQRVIKEFRKTHAGLQPISVSVDMLIRKVKRVDE